MPVFILTNPPQPPLERQGGTTYTFVSDGLEAALELAGAAAGDKAVGLWGSANVFSQYLVVGLIAMRSTCSWLRSSSVGAPRCLSSSKPRPSRSSPGDVCIPPGATYLRFGVVR